MKHNYEILFIYDVREANPNGDPDTQNQPRMDDEGRNIVTDTRLKRTIRDDLAKNGENILIKIVEDENGNRGTMENVCTAFYDEYCEKNGIKEEDKKQKMKQILKTELMKEFVDVRAFGGALTVKGANTSITGAIQFGLGKSLNKPNIISQTITTSLASGENKGQGSIGSYSYVDYSLIAFRGVLNAYQANQNGLTKNDFVKILKSMVNGTNNLNTRSKFNHKARYLIVLKMKEGKSVMGDIDLSLSINNEETELKSIYNANVNISLLSERIKDNSQNIENIIFVGGLKLDIKNEMELFGVSSKIYSMKEFVEINEDEF